MNRITRILLVALGISLVYSIIIYFVIQDGNKCDEHVKLNGGEEYDCRNVASFTNGMSTIKFCDGTQIDVPTNRIIEVTKIK